MNYIFQKLTDLDKTFEIKVSRFLFIETGKTQTMVFHHRFLLHEIKSHGLCLGCVSDLKIGFYSQILDDGQEFKK